MQGPEIVIIVAVGEQSRVIGKGEDLPWHIPEDLKRFKALTKGHPVLMGHRTFQSLIHQIGKPLPERRNIVLATDVDYSHYPNVEVFSDMDEALQAVKDVRRVFIGGGATVYRYFLPLADRIELTIVEGRYDGDVFFPPYEHLIGSMYDITSENQKDGFRFVTLKRNAMQAN
jgi:dihydrofolate reductase